MSDLSESGSSGLSDWALVNSQGELEQHASDADSNTSSIEIVGRETESEEEEGHGDPVSREASPECIELEQLRARADAASLDPESQHTIPECTQEDSTWFLHHGAVEDDDTLATFSGGLEYSPVQAAGACCSQLLQSTEREWCTELASRMREEENTLSSQLAHDTVSPASSDSIASPSTSNSTLSISGVSSLSTTSRSSRTDSDSESDFVRLEKESSCTNTESEGEYALSGSRANVMTTSGSSVGSGFNFLRSTRAFSLPVSPQPLQLLASLQPQPQQPQEEEGPLPQEHQAEGGPLQEEAGEREDDEAGERGNEAGERADEAGERADEAEERADEAEERADEAEERADEAEERADEAGERAEGEVVEEEVGIQHHQQAVAAAAVHQGDEEEEGDENDDDADTESSTEDGDQDDRIESEQSDDANDLDQGDLSVVNDLGDIPLERGGVERHYIHYSNQQLNGRLNRVVLAVLVLALGMGIGHWIGSTREHFSQLEIQLSQMRRLHQMQDEYMHCLSRNDELLVEADDALQGERNRHQEAMLDLRDNNRELQEQLQDAQDQLEQLLVAIAKAPKSAHGSLPKQAVLVASTLLSGNEEQFRASLVSWDAESQQHLLQARQSLVEAMEEAQAEHRHQLEKQVQEEAAKAGQLNLDLQDAQQRLNNLEVENAELKVNVGKMRYSGDSLSAPSMPPPPRPLPPPPFVGEEEQQDLGSDGKGTDSDELKFSLERDNDNDEEVAEQSADMGQGSANEEHGTNSGDTDGVEEKEITQHDTDIGNRASAKTERCIESPRPVPVDVTLLQRNLTQERQRAEKWRRLYLSEREETKPEMNASACLHLLTQRMNASSLLHYMTHWNLTGSGLEEVMDLTYLLSSMAQLQQNLLQAVPSLWEELTSTLHDLHQDFTHPDKGEPRQHDHLHRADSDHQEDTRSGDTPRNTAEEDGEGEGGQANASRAKWTDGVKKLLNKTRGTLSNASRHLQKTWDQVKDASSHLWSGDDSVIGRMAAQVKDGVRNLSHKVHNKASRWFKKRSKRNWKNEEREGHSSFQQEAEVKPEEDERKQTSQQTQNMGQQPVRTDQEQQFHSRGYRHRKKFHKHDKENQDHEDSDREDYKKSKVFDRQHREDGKKDGHHDTQGHRESGKETRFHTKAKHHSYYQEKSAAKAKYRVQKQFHKLFSKIGGMSKQSYYRMAEEDQSRSEVLEDVGKVLQLYNDNSKMGLPDSGHQWLKCQFLFWMRAERHRVHHNPKEVCLQYLAPWQLGFVQELRERVQRGECIKTRKFSCIDDGGVEHDEEENYKFVCIGDAQYKKEKDHADDDGDGDDDDDEVHLNRKSKESQFSPKGQRESGHDSGNIPTKSRETDASQGNSKPVNHTAEGPETWYFDWVQGRDILRTLEHKSDWLFERATDRRESRHQQHSADWVFERAAERDASRSEKRHKADDEDENLHDRWRRERSSRQGHAKKYQEKHHRGRDKSGHFKRHDKDYRQKYGRTSFCTTC